MDEPIISGKGGGLPAEMIDDAIFAVEGVIDFSVELRTGRHARLSIDIVADDPWTTEAVRSALLSHPIAGPLLQSEKINIAVKLASGSPFSLCRKRRVTVMRGEE